MAGLGDRGAMRLRTAGELLRWQSARHAICSLRMRAGSKWLPHPPLCSSRGLAQGMRLCASVRLKGAGRGWPVNMNQSAKCYIHQQCLKVASCRHPKVPK